MAPAAAPAADAPAVPANVPPAAMRKPEKPVGWRGKNRPSESNLTDPGEQGSKNLQFQLAACNNDEVLNY